MPDRPPFVTLRLTVPRMGSRDRENGRREAELIRLVQQRLPDGLELDGLYGCATARAVQAWQQRAGSANVTGAITPAELLILTGLRPRPADWKRRTAERVITPGRFRPPARPVKCVEPAPPITGDALRLIPRSAVGLRPRRGDPVVVPWGPGSPVTLHWQGDGNAAVGLEASYRQLRGFQGYHMDTHGWADIGYGVAIPRGCPVGTVIELRGFGVHGAHAGTNEGNRTLGVIVMVGEDDGGGRPTDDQYRTIEILRAATRHGRRYGHREWSATSCPGPHLWPWVQANR